MVPWVAVEVLATRQFVGSAASLNKEDKHHVGKQWRQGALPPSAQSKNPSENSHARDAQRVEGKGAEAQFSTRVINTSLLLRALILD
jgi:hypothetical protein